MKALLLSIASLGFVCNGLAQKSDSLKRIEKSAKAIEKNTDYVRIPAGSYFHGSNDSDLPAPDVNGNYVRARTISVSSFFMQKFEVSNAQYLEFVTDVMKEDSLLGATFLPDTLVWRTKLSYNEPYVDYYFRHPAYANYPVVGVSYTQAKAFAEWCAKKINSHPDRLFQEVKYRLPTEEEWEYAAMGGNDNSILPWGDHSTLDENGAPRANFWMVSQLSIYRETVTQDPNSPAETKSRLVSTGMGATISNGATSYSDVTAPVESYEPNGYGLYQMAGNVAEMVDAYYDRGPNVYDFSHDLNPLKSETPWGITKGGGWCDTGFYIQSPVRQYYDSPTSTSSSMGFRLVMDVVTY